MSAASEGAGRPIDAVEGEGCRALLVGSPQDACAGADVEDPACLLHNARGLRVVDAQLSAYNTWPLLLGLYWGLIVTALNANPYRRERPERERDI